MSSTSEADSTTISDEELLAELEHNPLIPKAPLFENWLLWRIMDQLRKLEGPALGHYSQEQSDLYTVLGCLLSLAKGMPIAASIPHRENRPLYPHSTDREYRRVLEQMRAAGFTFAGGLCPHPEEMPSILPVDMATSNGTTRGCVTGVLAPTAARLLQ